MERGGVLEHNNTIMYSGENHGLIWGGALEHIYTIVVTLSLSLCSAFNFNWWSKGIFQFDHSDIFVQYLMVTMYTVSAEPNILIMGGHGSGWAGPAESWNAPSSCSQAQRDIFLFNSFPLQKLLKGQELLISKCKITNQEVFATKVLLFNQWYR